MYVCIPNIKEKNMFCGGMTREVSHMILLITPGPRTGVISYSFISYLFCTMFSYQTKVAIIFIYA